MNTILQGEIVLAYSDEKGKFLALQNPDLQMWVWAEKTLPEDLRQQLFAELLDATVGQNRMKMVCSSESYGIVSALIRQKYSQSPSAEMELQPYTCPEPVTLNCANGKMIKAETQHQAAVAEFLKGFMLDGLATEVSLESQMERAKILINKAELFLWQDEDELVSLANIAIKTGQYARVSCVYTRPEQRGKGYAKMLMSELNKEIHAAGFVPLLYADAANASSNAVYRKCGYRPVYKLQEFEFIRC